MSEERGIDGCDSEPVAVLAGQSVADADKSSEAPTPGPVEEAGAVEGRPEEAEVGRSADEGDVQDDGDVEQTSASGPRLLGPVVAAGSSTVGRLYYEPEPALIRVGDEELEIDLKACAPCAVAFAVMRRRRLAGLPPMDPAVLFPSPQGPDTEKTENSDTGASTPAVSSAAPATFAPAPAPTASNESCDTADVNAQPAQAASTDAVGKHAGKSGTRAVDLHLPTFPGGMAMLSSIVRYLEVSAAEERAAAAADGHMGLPAGMLKVDPDAFHIDFAVDNIGLYLEAAALLRCPRILRETVLAPAAKDLNSRQVFALLGMLVRFTIDIELDSSIPDAGAGSTAASSKQEASGTNGANASNGEQQDEVEEYVTQPQVVQAFCQAIQRLCARLDAIDFKLSANLALGGPWASQEVLRAYKVKVENMGRVNYALQSMVTSTAKLFFYEEADKSTTQVKQLEWKEHHFALHVFRKHIIESTLYSKDPKLRAIAEKALLDEKENDAQEDRVVYDDSFHELENSEEADDDIPEAICDAVPSKCLLGLAAFVSYCEPMQTPPVLAAAMVRALLLTDETARARTLFEAIFVRSRKAQTMVIAGQIPVDFLLSVKAHRSASIVLRKLLGRHELHDRAELCHILDSIVLGEFQNEKHGQDLIMSNAVARDLTVYCRVSTRSVAALSDSGADEMGVIPGTSVDADTLRLRRVGERLFAAVFVTHNGFLPFPEEESWEGQGLSWTTAECPWDSGDLDLQLLQHVPNTEDALHLSRRVLLRGLWRRHRAGVESDVPTTVRLWKLGRWPSCQDAELISEAFSFLSTCWRSLRSERAAATWSTATSSSSDVEGAGPEKSALAAFARRSADDEESLFRMFTDLEFWRLQPKDLMTPWVPPHLLACHIASRCKMLDERQRQMSEENRQNLQEINRLRQIIRQLFTKLEVVDARSVHCLEKQYEVSDGLRSAMAT